MEPWLQITLTTAATLIGGVLLFVVGEMIRTLVINPLQTYREHVQLILDRLFFYANFYTRTFDNKLTESEQIAISEYTGHMRSAASQLNAKYELIGCKLLLIKSRIIPSADQIEVAYKNLIFLSNTILRKKDTNIEDSEKAANKIRSSLSART